MGCEVCIGGSIDDPIDGYERSIVETEKASECIECECQISVGSRCELVTGELDGKGLEYVTCILCSEIAEVFSCDQGRMHYSLWDDMQTYAFDELTMSSECFVKLSAAAKQRVLDKWNEWKFGRDQE